MSRHYYIEDISINRKTDDINPTEYVHSIQFNKLSDERIYINVDQPMNNTKSGKRALRASVIVSLEELKNAMSWLSECAHTDFYRLDSNTIQCKVCEKEIKA